MINAIAFTFYPVRDMKRARAFHEETLGLRLARREVRDFEWVEFDLKRDAFAVTNFANTGIPGAATGTGIACEMQNLDEAGRLAPRKMGARVPRPSDFTCPPSCWTSLKAPISPSGPHS